MLYEKHVIDCFANFQRLYRANPKPPFMAEVTETLARAVDLLERYLAQTPPPPGTEEWIKALSAWKQLLRYLARNTF